MQIKRCLSNRGNILEGVYSIKPKIYDDSRGFFYESWNHSSFSEALGENIIFMQDNHSSSNSGVLRGLHYQIEPNAQGKLIRCVSGSVFDVAVDIRKNSPTFSEWTSIILNPSNRYMIWIPSGFAHGFLSMKNNSQVLYKASGLWSKDHERSLRWDDKTINISWPLNEINCESPNLSEKDANAPYLENAEIFI